MALFFSGHYRRSYRVRVIVAAGVVGDCTKKNPTPHRSDLIGHTPVKTYKNP